MVEGARVSSKAQAGPREPSAPNFDPSKFGVIPIDPEVRKDIQKKKLQRLGPEFFHDTLPPNKPLIVPAEAVGAARSPSPVAPVPTLPRAIPDLNTTQLTARSLAARRRRQSLKLVGPLMFGAVLLLLFALLKLVGLVGRPTGTSEGRVTEKATDAPQPTAAPSVVVPELAALATHEPIALPKAVDQTDAAPHSSAAPPALVAPQIKSRHAPIKPDSSATPSAPPRAPEARDSKFKEFDSEAPLYQVGSD